jgi:hypothetical protein
MCLANPHFPELFTIRNQKKLIATKCYCVTLRRDFDNETAKRREV